MAWQQVERSSETERPCYVHRFCFCGLRGEVQLLRRLESACCFLPVSPAMEASAADDRCARSTAPSETESRE